MQLQELVQAIAAGLNNSVQKPNSLMYTPNPGGQFDFHNSNAFGRLLVGDNRSGKSIGGVNEAIGWLTGRHPYLQTPEPPVKGRVITVDFEYGADQIIEPLLRQWLPPSELINGSWEDSYKRRKHLLTLRNGSELEIKAHGQDLASFAGVPRHFLWCDEEPPKSIFIESKARLLDYNGKFWITMTPVQGMTWVYTDLVQGDPKNVKYFNISVKDNPYISQEAIDILASDLDDEEKQIRLSGGENFVPRGGLVLRNFDYDKHVIPPGKPPKKWSIYRSIDHGFNNPTAVHYHAVSPHGVVITFIEHYKSEMTVKQHCQRLKEIDKEWGIEPVLTVGDPSMSQRQATTGHSILTEYRLNGIGVVAGKKDVHGRIDKMNEYLRQDMWFITQDCYNFIREARLYRWKTYNSAKIADQSNKREEPNKKDDHSPDGCGYLFNFLPSLRPLPPNEQPRDNRPKLASVDFPWNADLQGAVSEDFDLAWGEVL